MKKSKHWMSRQLAIYNLQLVVGTKIHNGLIDEDFKLSYQTKLCRSIRIYGWQELQFKRDTRDVFDLLVSFIELYCDIHRKTSLFKISRHSVFIVRVLWIAPQVARSENSQYKHINSSFKIETWSNISKYSTYLLDH